MNFWITSSLGLCFFLLSLLEKESHVLRAMNLPNDVISGSLRLTLGPNNTMTDIDSVVSTIKNVVAELRRVSPLKEKYAF